MNIFICTFIVILRFKIYICASTFPTMKIEKKDSDDLEEKGEY